MSNERKKKLDTIYLRDGETDLRKIIDVMQTIQKRLMSSQSYATLLEYKDTKVPKKVYIAIGKLQLRLTNYISQYPEVLDHIDSIYTPELVLKKRKRKKEKEKEVSEHIDPYSPTVLEDIKHKFFVNKNDAISFIDIVPLMDNFEFIDLIVRAKIPFTSKRNSDLAKSLSKMLLYLSDKKALGRVGNTNAGKNTIEPANTFALSIGPILDELDEKGYKTLKSKADALNLKKILTIRGKEWTTTAIRNTNNRWKKLQSEEETPTPKKQPKP